MVHSFGIYSPFSLSITFLPSLIQANPITPTEKLASQLTSSSSFLSTQLAALVSGGQPNFAPLLYQHLVQRPEYQTPDERRALLRRLRETLMKLVIIVGVCKPLEAVFDLDAVVREEDKDDSATRYFFFPPNFSFLQRF